MKALLAIVLLLPALLFARESKLAHLSKLIKVNLNGQQTEFVITHSDEDNAYYRSNDYDGYENLLHISVSYSSKFYIQIYVDGTSYKVDDLETIVEDKTYNSSTQKIGKHGYRMEKNGFEYFFHSELVGKETKSELILSNLVAKKYFDRIDSVGKYTSELEYRPCDGCEHGDQFFITTPYATINVVYQDFGSFYSPTCDEELTPWLAQLIDLKVPFTFYGTTDASSPDYWEGTGDHWMAAKGELLIGTKKENQFSRFMQLVVFKTAEASGANPLATYDNIIENGKFIAYAHGELSFEYMGNIINFQL